jgi:hypothetical protein
MDEYGDCVVVSNWTTRVQEAKWRHQVFADLYQAGGTSRETVEVLMTGEAEIGFSHQSLSGAKWTFGGNIELDSDVYSWRTTRGDGYYAGMLGLIVHETTHLEQSLLLRLSLNGELEAWRAEAEARVELNAIGIGGQLSEYRQEIMKIPSDPSDRDLWRFRELIVLDQGGLFNYLGWLLPTYDPSRSGRGIGP